MIDERGIELLIKYVQEEQAQIRHLQSLKNRYLKSIVKNPAMSYDKLVRCQEIVLWAQRQLGGRERE